MTIFMKFLHINDVIYRLIDNLNTEIWTFSENLFFIIINVKRNEHFLLSYLANIKVDDIQSFIVTYSKGIIF